MALALELYGLLILTVLGFTLPILTVLLSFFPEGIEALSAKSEHERAQSEENIVNETTKKTTEKGLDYAALEITIKALKKKKSRAELRLEYVRPNELVIKIATPFGIAFVLALVAGQSLPLTITLIAMATSLGSFVLGLRALFTSISVLAEVSEMVSDARRTTEGKVIELLSTLVEKSGAESLFLKEGQVVLQLNKKRVSKDETFDFSVNKKHEIPVSIINTSDTMAKNVEVGLILPKDVVVEKSPNLGLHAAEKQQIVRFNVPVIHAHENYLKGRMSITFLKADQYKIEVFVKGENVKYQSFKINLKIVA